MDRDTAYTPQIPHGAEDRVVTTHPSGAPARVEYYADGELVGYRTFKEHGDVEVEVDFRGGHQRQWQYRWHEPGRLVSVEPYEDGLPHGTAYQWDREGRLIGTYTLEHGTGIDLWRQDRSDGTHTLAEVHYMRAGQPHGFEWWLDDNQRSVWIERHWCEGEQHGIEREWNSHGRLRRGYPRYWVRGVQVTKRRYLREAAKDPSVPPFRPEDNLPEREFPPEVAEHSGRGRESEDGRQESGDGGE